MEDIFGVAKAVIAQKCSPVRYYANRVDLTHEDMIADFLRRLPHDDQWASAEFLMREEVILGGSLEDYERALQNLVDCGRVQTRTS